MKDESEECRGVGRFPVPNTNCTDYILCTQTKKEIIGHRVSCPANTYFNPKWRQCSSTYVCVDYICQDLDIEEDVPYLDPRDKSNSSYIKCNFDEVYGALSASYHTCPGGSAFEVNNSGRLHRGNCIVRDAASIGYPVSKAAVTSERLVEFDTEANRYVSNARAVRLSESNYVQTLFDLCLLFILSR